MYSSVRGSSSACIHAHECVVWFPVRLSHVCVDALGDAEDGLERYPALAPPAELHRPLSRDEVDRDVLGLGLAAERVLLGVTKPVRPKKRGQPKERLIRERKQYKRYTREIGRRELFDKLIVVFCAQIAHQSERNTTTICMLQVTRYLELKATSTAHA